MELLFKNSSDHIQRKLIVEQLISESKTDASYYFMLSVAALTTTMGLSLNNGAIVIGGMLMAPLLTPMLAMGLGITTLSPKAIFRSLLGIFNSIATITFLSFLLSLIIHADGNYLTYEVTVRGEYSYLYLLVAIFSGLGATYAWIEHKTKYALSGVAVAVSLLPPLCVTGIALAQGSAYLLVNSLLIFTANITGIVISSSILFLFYRFSNLKRYEEHKIKKEE